MRLFFLILLFLNINLAADEYNFGEGINIPHTPIYVGGYGTLDYVSRADNYNRFRVDELSILSYGSNDRFSYMADFGLRDSYIKEWGSDDSSTTDSTISIERLYIDYQVNDSIRVRAGKFNTPAGYWNMEPINIFRETSSIPYTAFLVFPRFTSGLEVKYANSLYSDTEYSVVIQHNEDLDDTYNNIAIDKHYLASIEHFFSDSLKS